MKSEWEQKYIGDIISIRRGASPRPIKEFIQNEGMAWVKISDATASDSRYIYKTKEFIKLEGVSKSVLVQPEMLIVSNSATPGLPKIMKIPACVHDGWLVIDNYKGVLRDYLYYYFIDIRKRLVNLANGSVFLNLKTDIVKQFEIYLPPLPTQKAIADTLSCLDDKIENNNKINENLEAQAQALFKHWFIDFEFPNEEGKPYKSSGGKMVESELGLIPEGWRISYLSKIAEYLNGLAMQKFQPVLDSKSFPVLKIKELRQGITDSSSDRCNNNIDKQYIIQNGDVIFSWSGSLLVNIWTGGTAGLNQHLFKVTSNKFEKWFYYIWTKYHLQEFIQIAAARATTMGHIKRSHLDNAKVLIPNDISLNAMNSIMNPIIKKIILLGVQTQTLTKIRDTLLPKLMSGEIEVPIK